MALYGRNRGRLNTDQTHALQHPTRLRILELVARNPKHPLDVKSLTAGLTATEQFKDVEPGQVDYHRARLQDAELLPSG